MRKTKSQQAYDESVSMVEEALPDLPSPNTQNKEAIEAAIELMKQLEDAGYLDFDGGEQEERAEWLKRFEQSFQSAVEKAWSDGYVEGSNYQISIHEPAAQPQPRNPILIGKHIDIEFPVSGAARSESDLIDEARAVAEAGFPGAASSEPWHICPDCKVERTDYEGETDKYLSRCPNCGSTSAPTGAASSEPTRLSGEERGGAHEWSVTRLQAIVTHGGYEELSQAINAALAAERDKHTKAYLSFRQRLNAFEQQLAAEREKSRILGNMTDGFRNQIKEHQAEYDRLSKIMEKDSLTIVELNAAFADLQTDLALATQMYDIEGKRANEAEAALSAERERSKPLKWKVDEENKQLIAPTGERFSVGFASMDSAPLAKLINAALKAEREQAESWEQVAIKEEKVARKAEQALAAEQKLREHADAFREKARSKLRLFDELKRQLLQSQVAIAKHNDYPRTRHHRIQVDLSALREHDKELIAKHKLAWETAVMDDDAEVRKPLVEALESGKAELEALEYHFAGNQREFFNATVKSMHRKFDAALASVKERK